MKNTIHKGRVTFLILRKDTKYIGICKEFGFVEEADTAEEVEKKLIDGAKLLVDTVVKNPRLEPALNVRPPFKYWVLFYILPLVAAFALIFKGFRGEFRLRDVSMRDIPQMNYA